MTIGYTGTVIHNWVKTAMGGKGPNSLQGQFRSHSPVNHICSWKIKGSNEISITGNKG